MFLLNRKLLRLQQFCIHWTSHQMLNQMLLSEVELELLGVPLRVDFLNTFQLFIIIKIPHLSSLLSEHSSTFLAFTYSKHSLISLALISWILLTERPMRCTTCRFRCTSTRTQRCIRSAATAIANLRCPRSGACEPQWNRRRFVAAWLTIERQSTDQALAGSMRKDTHACQHRIRSTILRNDLLQRILQWPALCTLKARNWTFKCNFWDIPKHLWNEQFSQS